MKGRLVKIAIATATFACGMLLSIDSSGQHSVSLSVESALARVGRPLTPVSVAGVARRQNRRAGYGYGYGAAVVGAGLAAGAVAAATSPWGYQAYDQGYDAYGQPYGYYANDPNAAYASDQGSAGGYYADSPWGYYECRLPHAWECQPYSHIGWYHQ